MPKYRQEKIKLKKIRSSRAIWLSSLSVDIELFKKLGAEKHNNFYNYDKSVYCGKEKIIITCPIHGDFQQNIYSHLYGYICFKCGVEKRTKSQT